MLKLLAGKPGHRELPQGEPDPPGNLFDPPDFLSASQRVIWKDGIEGSPAGLLRNLDRYIFTTWVVSVDRMADATLHIMAEGQVVKQGGNVRITKHQNGSETVTKKSAVDVPSPWIAVYDKAHQQMIKATIELGFSPTSRSRIHLAAGGAKTQNKFSNNIARREA